MPCLLVTVRVVTLDIKGGRNLSASGNDLMSILVCVQSCYPTLRLGQLLSCAASRGGWTSGDLFYCPNDILIKGLNIMFSEVTQSYK